MRGTLSSPQSGHSHHLNNGLTNGYTNGHTNGLTNGHSKQYLGPKRLIANKGTEVFVVVDNEIRWSDLCMLKDDYEESKGKKRSPDSEMHMDEEEENFKSNSSYRVSLIGNP